MLDRLAQDPSHGEVYWFLWGQYDAVVERTRGRRMPWKTLLAEIQKLGLANAAGHPLDNIRTLESTWVAVQRDKRREAEAKQQRATERRRPTNDPPPVVARTWIPTAVPVAPVVPKTGTRTPEEQVEWMRNEILSRSGKRVR